MGLHLNWLAVADVEQAALLERLGMRASGAASSELDLRYACATLPSGWTVVVSAEYALDLDELLPAASTMGLALGCEVSETVMFSRLRAYRSGHLLWSVAHDGENDADGLETQGGAAVRAGEHSHAARGAKGG